jgi:hypothetical protein
VGIAGISILCALASGSPCSLGSLVLKLYHYIACH